MVRERKILTTYDADLRGVERGFKRLDRGLAGMNRKVARRLGAFDRRFEQSGRAAHHLAGGVDRFGQAMQAALAAAGITQLRALAEGWRQVGRELASIDQSSEAAGQSMTDLAIRVRTNVEAVSATVARFERSTRAGFDVSARRVETLGKLLTIAGRNAQERASVYLQLTQAVNKGQLNGDEFRALSENAPTELMDELARLMGVARGELKDLGAQGALTTDYLVRALDNLRSFSDQRFKGIAISGEEAFSVLRTGAISFVGRMDEALGATEKFNSLIYKMGEAMAAGGAVAEGLGEALSVVAAGALAFGGVRAVQSVQAIIDKGAEARRLSADHAKMLQAEARANVASLRQEIVAREANIHALRAEGGQSKKIGLQHQLLRRDRANLTDAMKLSAEATRQAAQAQAQLSAATRISTKATAAFRNTLAFLGGPIGVAFLGVTLALSSWASYADAAARSFERLKTPILNLHQVYGRVGDAVDEYIDAMDRSAEAQTEATRTIISELRKEIELRRELAREELANEKLRIAERADRLAASRERLTGLEAERTGSGRNRLRGKTADAAAARRKSLAAQTRKDIKELELAQLEAQRRVKETEARLSLSFDDLIAQRREKRSASPSIAAPPARGEAAPAREAERARREAEKLIRESLGDQERLAQDLAALDAQRGEVVAALREEAAARGAAADEAALQAEADRVLTANRRALLEQYGVVEPVERWSDQLRAARDLAADVMSEEEKLARIKERLQGLMPAMIELIKQEATARGEVVTNAQAEAQAKDKINAAIEKAGEDAGLEKKRGDVQALTKDLYAAAKGASSLGDAMSKMLSRLADTAITGFLDAITGPKSDAGGSGFLQRAAGWLGFRDGGPVRAYASGGPVSGPGGPRDDAILARLSDGEYVVNAAASARHRRLLDAINYGGLPAFASGGAVELPRSLPPPPPLPPITRAQPGSSGPLIGSLVINVTDQSGDPAAQARLISAAVEGKVAAIIMREKKPGGALA